MNKNEVVQGLKFINTFSIRFDTQPIFFGSVINFFLRKGELYRKISDIDLLLDINAKKWNDYLRQNGFHEKANKNIGFISKLGCYPIEYSKNGLRYSVILGRINDLTVTLPLKYNLKFVLKKEWVEYTYYWNEYKFLGFSPELYLLSLFATSTKSEKRTIDRSFLLSIVDQDKFLEVARAPKLYWGNKPIPFLENALYFKCKYLLNKSAKSNSV